MNATPERRRAGWPVLLVAALVIATITAVILLGTRR